jgi:hypothetical protein
MAKRGRPPKVAKPIESAKPTTKDTAVKNQSEAIAPTGGDPSITFDPTDRQNMYDGFKFDESASTEELEAYGLSGDEGFIKSDEQQTTEVPAEQEQTTEVSKDSVEDIQETEKPTEEAEVEETKKETTVPYDALHEERMRRKDADSQIKELLKNQQELMKDNRKLLEERLGQGEQAEDDGDELATRRELKTSKAEIEALRKEISDMKDWKQQSEYDNYEKKVMNEVDKVHVELEKEGFYGFRDWGKYIVGAKINDMSEEDKRIFGTPEGWKKLFKAEYPKIRNHFKEQHEEADVAKKEALKANANLVQTPGKTTTDSKKDKPWTMDDYRDMRSKAGIF